MIAYLDSSVLLRFILEQPQALSEIDGFEGLVTSRVSVSECLRAVDNARARSEIDQHEYEVRREAVFLKLSRVERVLVSLSVLGRAESSFPSPVGTLDAIHVATALQWRDRRAPDLVFATHDRQQAKVARLLGFAVIGV